MFCISEDALLSISMDLVVLCSATANRVFASYVCMCVSCGCVSATGICLGISLLIFCPGGDSEVVKRLADFLWNQHVPSRRSTRPLKIHPAERFQAESTTHHPDS